MNFKKVAEELVRNFETVSNNYAVVFQTAVDKGELYNLYLDSYESNKVFRINREYECSACRAFIKEIGNLVFVRDDLTLDSIWNFLSSEREFIPVAKALHEYVTSKPISNIYLGESKKIGKATTIEILPDTSIEWDHFYLQLPQKYIIDKNVIRSSLYSIQKEEIGLFNRSLDTITIDACDTVLELMDQNSLYRGKEFNDLVKSFRNILKVYNSIDQLDRNTYIWAIGVQLSRSITGIKNSAIGTLLVDLSEDRELEEAVKAYEVITAPANYKRPTALVTKAMIDNAEKVIIELGYENSLGRRYAIDSDISANNVLYVNRNIPSAVNQSTSSVSSIFDNMREEALVNPKSLNKCKDISMGDFIEMIPNIDELSILMENKLRNNLMSLIAPKDASAPSMFKWNNNFGWSYNNNLADSDIKQNVAEAGGKVDGVLRFSIQWNEGGKDEYNGSDYDIHCIEPLGTASWNVSSDTRNRIFYGAKNNISTTGTLDIDIQRPEEGKPAVENITWSDKTKMKEGIYDFLVHIYANRASATSDTSFRTQLEFDGEVYDFVYTGPVTTGSIYGIFSVELKGGKFTLLKMAESVYDSKEIWNIKTNTFVPVKMILNSPNYWDLQNGIGNKHYFFILRNCINPSNPNGFYNEYLKNDLNPHRKVFSILGSKMKVDNCTEQLSGVGFSETIHKNFIVRVKTHNGDNNIFKVSI